MKTKQRVRQRKNNRFMGGEELLHKATKGWKFKVDNKLRGAFGETDFDTKTVTINKKKHKDKKMLVRERVYNRLPNGTESILDTINHELGHVVNPKASEGIVEKKAKGSVKKLSPRQKKKLYGLFDK